MSDSTIRKSIFDDCELSVEFTNAYSQSLDPLMLSSLTSTYTARVCGAFNLKLDLPNDHTCIKKYSQCIITPAVIPLYQEPSCNSTFPGRSHNSFITQQPSSLLPLLIGAYRSNIDIRQYHIISERNSLRKIGLCNENYAIGVRKMDSVLFLRRHDRRVVDMNDFGLRFERMCTPDYHVNASYHELVEGCIGDLRMLISAETDAVTKDNKAIELKCTLKPGLDNRKAHDLWLQTFLSKLDKFNSENFSQILFTVDFYEITLLKMSH